MEALLSHPLFASHPQQQSTEQRIRDAYLRAVALGKASGLKAQDCVRSTHKFWDLNGHPLAVYDTAASAIITAHYNLCLSTIGRYERTRPDLQGVIQKLENWDVNGILLITELGHGIDAINLETTATFTTFPSREDGKVRKGFVLHTPCDAAQKYMSPATPMGNIPKVAIVHARLIVKGKFRGIRVFVVPITDGFEMCKGISAKFIGPLGGKALDYALIRFANVELPLTSLLCANPDIESELLNIDPNKNETAATYFSENTLAVHTSKVAVSLLALSMLKIGTYIFTKYSLWRSVFAKGLGDGQVPIMVFRTQQIPCVEGLAKSLVFSAWANSVTRMWTNQQLTLNERMAISAIFKHVVNDDGIEMMTQFIDRCGAQGLFAHNRLTTYYTDMVGISIAEGHTLVVGIKVASELIMGRYSLPPPADPSHPLAQHEISLFDEARELALSISTSQNKAAEYNRIIMPMCGSLMRAAGYRLAYEAAKEEGVDDAILDMFMCTAFAQDPAWYSENINISRKQQREKRDAVIDKIFTHENIEKYLHALGVEKYVSAPILSPGSLLSFHNSLPTFVGDTRIKSKL